MTLPSRSGRCSLSHIANNSVAAYIAFLGDRKINLLHLGLAGSLSGSVDFVSGWTVHNYRD